MFFVDICKNPIKVEFRKFRLSEKLEPIEKFINLESLLVIYAVLIKAKPDQSISDVIDMVLFVAKGTKEQPNETLALCKYAFPCYVMITQCFSYT